MSARKVAADPEGQFTESDQEEESDEEHCEVPNVELEEDMFGAALCMVMRDAHFISKHKGKSSLRYLRLVSTLTLMAICICTQVYLLYEFKKFVTAKAVHDIREAYDIFENAMYDDWELTVNGNKRGVGPFHHERFANLTDDEQSAVCRIPLSQPHFFFVILCVWSLSCFSQVKRIKADFQSLILNTDRVSDMAHSQEDMDGDEGDLILIKGLTLPIKAVILIFILIPRFLITIGLLWLGCRWLLATNNFADLILNAVALEFVLMLKDTLYVALMSERNKRDMANTQIKPPEKFDTPSVWNFTGTISWCLITFVWVASYMGIPHYHEGWQTVLPEYRWDVKDVCQKWIEWRYCIEANCPKHLVIEM